MLNSPSWLLFTVFSLLIIRIRIRIRNKSKSKNKNNLLIYILHFLTCNDQKRRYLLSLPDRYRDRYRYRYLIVIVTCTLLSGRLILLATSSRMKISGYLVLAKSSSKISS